MLLPRLMLHAVSLCLVASAAASANVIVDQEIAGPASTNWGTSSNSSNFAPTQTLNFAGFNRSLGTLTSVVISATENIIGSVNITNNGSSATGVDASLINTLKINLPGLTTIKISDESSDYSATLAGLASSGFQPVSGTESDAPTTITDPTTLAFYETPWTAILGDRGGVSVSSDNGNGTAVYTDSGEGVLNITYTYTPNTSNSTSNNVPEPATLALVGSGLIGCGVIRHRRK